MGILVADIARNIKRIIKRNKKLNILAIVTTIEFQNRATIEALSKKYKNVRVVVKRNIKDYFKPKTQSIFVDIDYFYTLFPEKTSRKYKFISFLELSISYFFLRKKLNNCDICLVTSIHITYLLPLLKNKYLISLFVDPYSLMNGFKSKKEEVLLAEQSDLLLCTSKQLATTYCKKHLNIDVEGHYWPNTADLDRWNFDKFNERIITNEIVFGYAGNMNEITIDLELVELLISEFPEIKFRFAGSLNFSDPENVKRMKNLLIPDNVSYIGKIPYESIQEEVFGWDVCLMLDNINELSKYVHHNKVYQYLALGKVVVATKTHDDYSNLVEEIFEAETKENFIEKAREAIKVCRQQERISNRIKLARTESADVRAAQLMDIIKKNV